MRKLIDENIVLGKFQDTDIDEYSIFFSHNMESSLVDEFELPEDHNYIVMTGTQKGEMFPDWVTIANPEGLKEVIEKDKKCLPDLHFEFRGEKITLIDLFKKHIFNLKAS